MLIPSNQHELTPNRTHTAPLNVSLAATYDPADRLTAEGTALYAYDPADQLAGVTGSRYESYVYDSGGNRAFQYYTVAPGNRLASDDQFDYTYDGEGNLARQTKRSNGDYTTYAYDHRDRMTGITSANSGGTATYAATYTYDALDRRVGQLVDDDGAGWHVPVQTWTVWDGTQVYADLDVSGAAQARYLTGPAVDELLARTDGSGATAWYLTDRTGSVRDFVSSAGAVLDHVAYGSFGTIVSESAPLLGDRFKYAGREFDAGSGLLHNRARNLQVRSGRWTQEDPIGFGGGDANLYRYVGNSPTLYTDPMGLCGDPAGTADDYDVVTRFLAGQASRDPLRGGNQDHWKKFNGGYLGTKRCMACHGTGILEGRSLDTIDDPGLRMFLGSTPNNDSLYAAGGVALQGTSALGQVVGGLLAAPETGGTSLYFTARGLDNAQAIFTGTTVSRWLAGKAGVNGTAVAVGEFGLDLGPGAVKSIVKAAAAGSRSLIRSVKKFANPKNTYLFSNPLKPLADGVGDAAHSAAKDAADSSLAAKAGAAGQAGKLLAPNTPKLGQLRSSGPKTWDSAGGLRYTGTDPNGLNRVQHVLKHADDIPNRPVANGVSVPRTASGAESAAQYAKLKDFYGQAESYGSGGISQLGDGRYRFYGDLTPSTTPGEMAGRRVAREWNPASGNTRTWMETLDQSGRIRIVRPETGGPKIHYLFDAGGNYVKSF